MAKQIFQNFEFNPKTRFLRCSEAEFRNAYEVKKCVKYDNLYITPLIFSLFWTKKTKKNIFLKNGKILIHKWRANFCVWFHAHPVRDMELFLNQKRIRGTLSPE